jgi:hypothetical protein
VKPTPLNGTVPLLLTSCCCAFAATCCRTGKWTTFDTAVDVAIRDAGHKPDVNAKAWPGDKQGYSLISQADTADNWAKHNKQWVKHETTFTAPSDMVG